MRTYELPKKPWPGRPGYKNPEDKMQLVSFHLPREWILQLDLLVKAGKAPSRSELIRYAIRDVLIAEGISRPLKKEVF